jgi:hypothetical protein
MGARRKDLLIRIFLTSVMASTHIGCTQTSRSLQNRIPKPDPEKYHSVRDAKNWRNPYLIVRRDGVEIVGVTPVGRAIAIESVPEVLERLPNSAWPYGLVVAVQDIGILSGKTDPADIEANRTKLQNLMKELGITVDGWPSA